VRNLQLDFLEIEGPPALKLMYKFVEQNERVKHLSLRNTFVRQDFFDALVAGFQAYFSRLDSLSINNVMSLETQKG